MIRDDYPGTRVRIFFPSRILILDPGIKKYLIRNAAFISWNTYTYISSTVLSVNNKTMRSFEKNLDTFWDSFF